MNDEEKAAELEALETIKKCKEHKATLKYLGEQIRSIASETGTQIPVRCCLQAISETIEMRLSHWRNRLAIARGE